MVGPKEGDSGTPYEVLGASVSTGPWLLEEEPEVSGRGPTGGATGTPYKVLGS